MTRREPVAAAVLAVLDAALVGGEANVRDVILESFIESVQSFDPSTNNVALHLGLPSSGV